MAVGEDVGHYGGSYKVTYDLYKKFGDMRVLDTPICGKQAHSTRETATAAAALGDRSYSSLQRQQAAAYLTRHAGSQKTCCSSCDLTPQQPTSEACAKVGWLVRWDRLLFKSKRWQVTADACHASELTTR